jgi:hypothetical protein
MGPMRDSTGTSPGLRWRTLVRVATGVKELLVALPSGDYADRDIHTGLGASMPDANGDVGRIDT